MIELPVNSAGARRVRVNTGAGGGVFTFRTHYSYGQNQMWLLDIIDAGGNLLAGSLPLVPGSDNILKGQGDVLEGYQLYVFLEEGRDGGNPEALGVTLRLVWYNPGEENLYQTGDPLDTIGRDYEWQQPA